MDKSKMRREAGVTADRRGKNAGLKVRKEFLFN